MPELTEWECPRCNNYVVSKTKPHCHGQRGDTHPPVGMEEWDDDNCICHKTVGPCPACGRRMNSSAEEVFDHDGVTEDEEGNKRFRLSEIDKSGDGDD